MSTFLVGLVACGDDPATNGTDTSSADTSATNDDTSTLADGDAESDVPVITCNVGDKATGTVGDSELVLEVCGARLIVPASAGPAGADGTAITFEAIAPPGIAPFERAFVGPVLQVTVDSEMDLVIPYTLHVLDTASEGGYRTTATWVGLSSEWGGFEACPEEDGFSFQASFTAIFALFRDTVIFPASKEGLGDGALKSKLDGGAQITWSTDDGYAIHDTDVSGLKSVTVAARITDGDATRQLQIQLTEESDHTFTPIEVSLLDTADAAQSFAWLQPIDGPATTSSIIPVGTRIVGSFTVQARNADGTKPLVIDIDVSTERYRHPPAAACLPEG